MTRSDIQSRIAYWADQYGVPPSLALAVAQRESGFNQDARGSSGEVGVMQLKPGTAADLGVDPYDPDANIRGGVDYLSRMYAQFGDWGVALSGYNAGPGTTASYGGVHPKSQLYVAEVLAQAGMLSGGAPPEVPGYEPPAPAPEADPLAGLVPESARVPLLALAGALVLVMLTD